MGAALAAANTVDAAQNVVDAVKEGGIGGLVGSVTVSAGFSSSRSSSTGSDQTVVGSSIQGGDVTLIARGVDGVPNSGTVNITGSEVLAGRDLTIAATGAVTASAAQETDTQSSRNRSSGANISATVSADGLTLGASGNLSRGNSSGTDVTNIESVLSATQRNERER